jgi:hypothetical protein
MDDSQHGIAKFGCILFALTVPVAFILPYVIPTSMEPLPRALLSASATGAAWFAAWRLGRRFLR